MRSRHDYTLLHRAARYNSTSCVRVLLGFAPHLVDAVNDLNYETPLMMAVEFDRRDVAKMLLRAGADVRKKCYGNRTVFDMARKKEMLKILNQHQ